MYNAIVHPMEQISWKDIIAISILAVLCCLLFKSQIRKGNYFQSIDGDPLKFALIRRKLALIPAASVVFICDDDDIENSSSDGLLVK
jgi:hypothetical protein